MEIDDYLKSCELCPRRCKVNRIDTVGRCKQGKNIRIALSSLHHFEEPCISEYSKEEGKNHDRETIGKAYRSDPDRSHRHQFLYVYADVSRPR